MEKSRESVSGSHVVKYDDIEHLLCVVREAVVIDAPNAFLCILGEHLHLNRCFGRGRWHPYRVTTHEVGGRIYDRYDVWFGSGLERITWFDITSAVARWAPERQQQSDSQ